MGISRNIYKRAQQLLKQFPAIAILGARQTGKTVLSQQLAPNWDYFDLEKTSTFNQVTLDPELFLKQYNEQIILDEVQRVPELFNLLRGIIDNKRHQKSRFILTGSSSPELLNKISESLAGRIAIIELGTFKTNESFQTKLSPFYQLFENKLDKESCDFRRTLPALTLDQMHQHWLYGGYPEPTLQFTESFYANWMENYFKTYINQDISALFPKLNKINYQRFLTMLGKLSGTIINKSEIARSIEASEKSIRQYLHIAEQTYLWRSLTSFEQDVQKAIVKMPKGYMRDSGLLHFLLKINDKDALYSSPIVGHSFESFVIEEILKGLTASSITNWNAYYYRTRAGAEIDLILQGTFGTLPIEIKYGTRTPLKQLKTLTNFIQERQLPFGILINQSDRAHWLTPEIYQLPVNYL